jgi:dihydrofolate synthase/folylpolyglutamate synthase
MQHDEPLRTFQEAIAFLEEGINYEKTRTWKYNEKWLKLERVVRLLDALGNPHQRYPIIHVAGTKGKGTTSGAAAHLLHTAGNRTGVMTSPHLVTARERVRVNGELIPEAEFVQIVEAMRPYVQERRTQEQDSFRVPTYFEMLTALAFEHFARRQVDWAVVEVGLGGRLDSTNVVEPSTCVVTAIGMDHMDKLGDTPGQIAAEKAGILKTGVPVLIGRQHYAEALDVLLERAEELDCPVWQVGSDLLVQEPVPLGAPAHAPDSTVGWEFSLQTPSHEWGRLYTPMLGRHQLDNLAAAVGAVDLATKRERREFDAGVVPDALRGFQVPGRLELIRRGPATVLDVAHTVESIEAMQQALATHFPDRAVHLVFGCSRDKNLPGMMRVLAGHCATFTATEARFPRARPTGEVAQAARQAGVAPCVREEPDAWQAFRAALQGAEPADVVCAAGSFFTTGEIRGRWHQEHSELPE